MTRSLAIQGLLLLGLAALAACSSSAPPPPPSAGSGDGTEKEEGAGAKPAEATHSESSTKTPAENSEPGTSESKPEEEEEKEETTADDNLLYPEKLKECHDNGVVYDRRTASETDAGECHTAKYPGGYDCTDAGITEAFGDSAAIKDYLAKQKTDGFKIDQCGKSGTKGIVFFVKTAEDATEMSVRVVEEP